MEADCAKIPRQRCCFCIWLPSIIKRTIPLALRLSREISGFLKKNYRNWLKLVETAKIIWLKLVETGWNCENNLAFSTERISWKIPAAHFQGPGDFRGVGFFWIFFYFLFDSPANDSVRKPHDEVVEWQFDMLIPRRAEVPQLQPSGFFYGMERGKSKVCNRPKSKRLSGRCL